MNHWKLGAIFILLPACGGTSTTTGLLTAPMPAADTLAYRACTADSDCVYVDNGCCDCANGGEALAVNTDKRTLFQASFDCSEAVCTLVAAEPACGSGTVTCENLVCQYLAP